MTVGTLLLYLAMYVYGFYLMIWAMYYDKRRTKTTYNAALIGFIGLILTVFYTIYVLFTVGLK